MFQFQLVRLQLMTGNGKYTSRSLVSIPIGAITVTTSPSDSAERQSFNSNWCDYSHIATTRTGFAALVSIPIGAITVGRDSTHSKFSSRVSIPIGAITVFVIPKCAWNASQFQFQLVRLQSSDGIEWYGYDAEFQFQLVRLQ